jgi:hypothetical protein
MSHDPKQVWQRLSAKQQKETLIELLRICQEIIYEHLRTSNIKTPSTQSNCLHPTVNTASNNN